MTDASGLLDDVFSSVLTSSLSDLVGFLPGELGDGHQREGSDPAMAVSTPEKSERADEEDGSGHAAAVSFFSS